MTSQSAAVIAVAFVSMALGSLCATIVFVITVRRQAEQRRNLDSLQARWARWLAARRTLSRATVSLVAAFRALEQQSSSGVQHPWRYEEVQRTRAHWCDAAGEQERAEAELQIAYLLSHEDAPLGFPKHPATEGFRTAITGSSEDVSVLLASVRQADQQAVQFALGSIRRELARRESNRRFPPMILVAQWARFMGRLIEGWAGR